MLCLFFFFNAPPTSVIYPLSLHDALPISVQPAPQTIGDDDHGGAETTDRLIGVHQQPARRRSRAEHVEIRRRDPRSEEHTSELQSPYDLVCRLLLEKKKKQTTKHITPKTT